MIRIEYEGQARLCWTGDELQLELLEPLPRLLDDVLETEFETIRYDSDELLGRIRIVVEQLEPPKEPPPRAERYPKRRTLHEPADERIPPPGEAA